MKFRCEIEEVYRDGKKVPYEKRWSVEISFEAPDMEVAEATLNRMCEGKHIKWFNLEEN